MAPCKSIPTVDSTVVGGDLITREGHTWAGVERGVAAGADQHKYTSGQTPQSRAMNTLLVNDEPHQAESEQGGRHGLQARDM